MKNPTQIFIVQNKHKDSFHSPEQSTLRNTSVNLHLNQVILLVLLNVNHVYVFITCLLNIQMNKIY